jgi:hypothetical protein
MRMPIVIRDATIVASDAARTVHHEASIVVDDDRIAAIGRRVWRQLAARYPNVPFPIRLPRPVSAADAR